MNHYYGGIQFSSTAAARAARTPIVKFLKAGTAAYNDWQSHRNSKTGEKRLPAKERFRGIAKRNKDVFETLDLVNRYDEFIAQFRQQGENDAEDGCLNCLSGQMSFPNKPTVAVEGDMVIFFGNVWHFADWDRLLEGMRKQFGGINAAWVSDEYVVGTAEKVRAELHERLREPAAGNCPC